jgi:hypothetical protein
MARAENSSGPFFVIEARFLGAITETFQKDESVF